MNPQNQHIVNLSDDNDDSRNFLEKLDFDKIRGIIFRSLVWVILINTFIIFTAYIYLKYQKPLYQSNSLLKLTVENEKVISNLGSLIRPNQEGSTNSDNVIGELEIIRSNVVLETVADTAKNLHVSYFSKGNFVDKEMYGYSPFKVIYTQKEINNLYDKKIDLTILNQQEYEINLDNKKTRYQFGKEIQVYNANIKILKDHTFNAEFIGIDYYFIIHSKNSLIEYLQKNLILGQQNKNANTFSIGFKEYEALKARDIVGLIDSIYIEKTREDKNKSNKMTLEFLEQRIKEYKDSLNKYSALLQTLFLENKTKNIDSKVQQAIEKLEELGTKRSLLNRKLATLVELQTLIEDEKGIIQDEFYFYQIQNESIKTVLSSLREKLLNRKILYDRVKPGGKTSKLNTLNIEITQLKKDLQNTIKAVKQQVITNREFINEEIAEAQSILQNLPSKGDDYAYLEQQYQVYKNLYDQFVSTKINITVAQAGVIPKSILLSPASIPKDSIGTPSFVIYSIATLLGIFLSIGLVLIRYFLHNKIMNAGELGNILNPSLLGTIPLYRKQVMEYSQLVVDKNPKSSLNEAIRDIRTNLEFMLPNDKGLYNKNNPPILSVTSTISGEGKTFVVSNLGGLIAMVNIKVIILDFDMRKPKLHLALGGNNDKGISTVLIGKTDIEECIQKTKIEHLDFISSGPTPPNPSELILRDDFDTLISNLKQKYDVIMIDTPPVGLVTDAMLIMKKVDLPMYIMKANYSRKTFTKDINRLHKKEFNNISVVLNAVKASKGYGYGYGYGYYAEDKQHNGGIIKRITKIFKRKRK